MTDNASPPLVTDPVDAQSGLEPVSGAAGIDPEDTAVVPAALTRLVTSARSTLSVMRVNSCYPPSTAVEAVEGTVAALTRISSQLELYVGDYSGQGGKAVVRASDLLGQARSALSEARHHLGLDDMPQPDPMPLEGAALTG